jgi:hypothetical protein
VRSAPQDKVRDRIARGEGIEARQAFAAARDTRMAKIGRSSAGKPRYATRMKQYLPFLRLGLVLASRSGVEDELECGRDRQAIARQRFVRVDERDRRSAGKNPWGVNGGSGKCGRDVFWPQRVLRFSARSA